MFVERLARRNTVVNRKYVLPFRLPFSIQSLETMTKMNIVSQPLLYFKKSENVIAYEENVPISPYS